MKLEDQVCSLELAKELKDLGVAEPSIFIYDGTTTELTQQNAPYYYVDGFNAYSVAELGEMFRKGTWLNTFFHSHEIQISEGRANNNCMSAKNEADARAKTLIYLIKKGIVTP